MAKSNVLLTEEQMSKLEPLVSLEAVRPRGSAYMLMVLFMGSYVAAMVGIMAFMCSKYTHYLDSKAIAIFGVVGLFLVWFVIRGVTGYYYFSTDASGIRLRGVLSRRYVAWPEVTGAVVKQTMSGYPQVVLDTARGKIRVDVCNTGSQYVRDAIIASIWYNLRKTGRADGMLLPASAMTYWESISDEVPREVDWRGSSLKGAFIATVVMSVTVLASFVYLLFDMLHNVPMAIFYSIATIAWICIMRYGLSSDALRTATRITVREGYIEAAFLFGKLYLPWSEVSCTEWGNDSLRIISENPYREIRVPRRPGSKESEQLLLSIIRHLRTAGIAVGMPSAVVTKK